MDAVAFRRYVLAAIALGLAFDHQGLATGEHVEAEFGRHLTQLRQDPASRHSFSPLENILSRYFSQDELEEYLKTFALRCKRIARLFSIGQSVKGRELWVLEISDKPGQREAEPNFKWIGNVHGDEPLGRQLTIGLAEWLCEHYTIDPRAHRLVNHIHLYLMPSMNPDAFEKHRRHNSGDKDLNRNFPDPIYHPNLQASGKEEPETQAIMNWTLNTHFTASAAFHEGAVVANYPWDGTRDGSSTYNGTTDDATFRYLARSFANLHTIMNQSKEFENGITNGAAWYPVYGGMQDWNYIAGRCFELTLELNDRKWPAAEHISRIWHENHEALLTYPLVSTLSGLRGSIRDHMTGQPLVGNVTVEGSDFVALSEADMGDFYRPLAPGNYTAVASVPNYASESIEFSVPLDGSGFVHNFHLHSLEAHEAVHSESSIQHWVLRKNLGRSESQGGTTVQGRRKKLSISWVPFLVAQALVLGIVVAQIYVIVKWRSSRRRKI